MSEFKVCQKVFARHVEKYRATPTNQEAIPGVVSKVGRKYVYVKLNGGYEHKFRLYRPHIQVYDEGYSPDYVLYNSEEAVKNYWQSLFRIRQLQDGLSKLLHFVEDLHEDGLEVVVEELEDAEKAMTTSLLFARRNAQ